MEVFARDWGTAARWAADLPGAGAAGGLGFAAMALLDAERRPGVDVLLDVLGAGRLMDGPRLVVTGEGSLDRQSLRGKAPVGGRRVHAGRAWPADRPGRRW
ncbi:glycerate kinase [Peterkaempfera griseoplana]|uniref:glycerate kinase n=1 Tax=Peterkaempfera griseoplana TaxID=66896 RepID=UPI002244F517|nr:glycerate kinase [Peterkaempfera griseoplana]